MVNETEAPTNAGTHAKLEHLKTSEEELDFVTLVNQFWLVEGRILTRSDAIDRGVPETLYSNFLRSPSVKEALEQRGITWPPPVGDLTAGIEPLPEWRTTGLTPMQLVVANVMLDATDTRSNKKKLQDLNVTTLQFQAWLRDEKFSGYLKQRAEQLFGAHQHEARLALMDRVSAGDIKAIELYLEMTGEYTRVSAANSATNFDVQGLIVSIVEIIAEEVDDPATAARIADRFKTLMSARAVANELVNPTQDSIVKPEVAKPREMTPDMLKLAALGGNS